MPGVGAMARARPDVSAPCQGSTFWYQIEDLTHDPLPLCRLSLAAPAREWLVSLADASDLQRPDAPGDAPVPEWHTARLVALATST